MAAVTLTTLLSRVRSRADMVSSAFVTDADITVWLNEGAQKLHEKLVEAMGEEYVSSSSTLTTVAGTKDYALPATFYKLYGVELPIDGDMRSLTPYNRAERNNYTSTRFSATEVPRYSLVGSNLRILPTPSSALVGAILFAPTFTLLSSGSDTCNFPNGWERYVVLYAAIQALLKEESSVSGLSQMLLKEEKDLDEMKQMRDLAAPKQVVDLGRDDWWFP